MEKIRVITRVMRARQLQILEAPSQKDLDVGASIPDEILNGIFQEPSHHGKFRLSLSMTNSSKSHMSFDSVARKEKTPTLTNTRQKVFM